MRTFIPTPTVDPLPYARDAPDAGSRPASRVRPQLRSDAIARFDALLHEINPDAPRADPARLEHLIDWLLSLPEARAHGAVERRLRRFEELRAMLEDADWDTDPATRMRLAKLVDYVDRDDDLIPDHEPMAGLLDDVLLIELAWPAFADEADEYRDFCIYRNIEHPGGDGDLQRAAWIRDRTAEIALLRHRWQLAESHYVPPGRLPPRFRVS